MGDSGISEPAAAARGRARRAVVVAAIVLASLAAALVVSATLLTRSVSESLQSLPDPFPAIPTRPTEPSPAPSAATGPQPNTKPVNILILGSDSREVTTDPSRWHAGAQRTDTIMLLHVPADRGGAAFISFPRDSWVPVPGHGHAKLNAAYSFGGFPLLIQTFEQLTGIRVDHVALANFASFAALTDAVGGVEITIPEDTYEGGRLSFSAGTHLMDGQEALRYARQRHGLPGGDLDRIKRQQNWMRAMLTRAVEVGAPRNPVRLTSLARTVSRSVAVDEGFDLAEMTGLAMSLRGADLADIAFMTVPVEGLGWSPDGLQSIVVLDKRRLDRLARAVIHDEALAYARKHADQLDLLGTVVR